MVEMASIDRKSEGHWSKYYDDSVSSELCDCVPFYSTTTGSMINPSYIHKLHTLSLPLQEADTYSTDTV